MSKRGGEADKVGGKYELAWTVSRIIEVLQEQAQTIRIEAPGTEAVGAEFELRRGGVVEYHQCKTTSDGARWTIGRLSREGILRYWWAATSEEQHEYHFVSTSAVVIEELARRAKQAEDFEEFSSWFLSDQNHSQIFEELVREIRDNVTEVADAFEHVREVWRAKQNVLTNGPSIEANPISSEDEKVSDYAKRLVYERLRRIRIVQEGEHSLRGFVDSLLISLINADAVQSFSVLQELASSSIRRPLKPSAVRRYLEAHGLVLKDPAFSDTVQAKLNAVNEQFLHRLDSMQIGGTFVERPVVTEIIEAVRGKNARLLLVTGAAGSGKSGVILRSVRSLVEYGWTVLGFRADTVPPDCQMPTQLSTWLQLPGMTPPLIVTRIADESKALLIIDQLDSISTVSGRSPELFDVVSKLIHDSRNKGVTVLTGCRKFDIDNDYRLRQLLSRPDCRHIQVPNLTRQEIQAVLAGLGITANPLSARLERLFSIPWHLKMLEEIGAEHLDFETENELFDRFWIVKSDLLDKHCGTGTWTKIIMQMVSYMVEHQQLIVPKSALAQYAGRPITMLLSEHVLLDSGTDYQFFHESLFDYAFGRWFVDSGKDLQRLLLSSEQFLTRRAQVRPVLLYSREANAAQYTGDLNWLLNAEEVRFHIKVTVFDLLSAVHDVTPEEWSIAQSFLFSPTDGNPRTDILARRAWSLLFREPWFAYGMEIGTIVAWLRSSNPQVVEATLHVVMNAEFALPDPVVEALKDLATQTGHPARQKFLDLLSWAKLHQSRRFFDLYMQLIEDGSLDSYYDSGNTIRDFWGHLYTLAEEKPSWACEALAVYLTHGLQLARERGIENPLDWNGSAFPHSQMDGSAIDKCAARAPMDYILAVLPFVAQVAKLTVDPEHEPPREDRVWAYRHMGEGYGLRDKLFNCLEEAVMYVARAEPSAFRELLPLLDSDFESLVYLTLRSYSANPAEFADEAVSFLCEDPRRLRTGYSDSSHWGTRLLLEAITPTCSAESLGRLESLLLNYYPDWEKKAESIKYYGSAQFDLLPGIAMARRSSAVTRRIGELERKLKWRGECNPQFIKMRKVQSPIPDSATPKMKDTHWITALRKYHDEPRVWREHKRDGTPIGGAHELSGQLQVCAKTEPIRFISLTAEFGDDINPIYFDAILRGVADSNYEGAEVFTLVSRCHSIPNRPCGRAICHLMERKATLAWPSELLDALAWYATEDPDPDKEAWQTLAQSGQPFSSGDPFHAGINSTRGEAAEAIGAYIFEHPEKLPELLPLLQRMANDMSAAVRSVVAYAIGPVLNHDRDLAVALFIGLCQTHEDVLSTPHVQRFMRFAIASHLRQLAPLVVRMLESSSPKIVEDGAEVACLADLAPASSEDQACSTELVNRCWQGSVEMRKGLAAIFSANVGNPRFRNRCSEALLKLFQDSAPEVRAEAGKCFTRFKGDDLGSACDLITTYAKGESLKDESFHLLHALDETTAKLPDITIFVCERIIELYQEAAGDKSRSSIHTHDIHELVIRLYRHTDDEKIRSRCLDLIDRLLEAGIFGLEGDLEELAVMPHGSH